MLNWILKLFYQQLIFKFGLETKEETDEIIIIPESDHTLNIAQ